MPRLSESLAFCNQVYPPKLQIPQDKQIRNSDFRNLLSACMSTGATSHLSEGLGVEAAEVRDEKQKTGGSFQVIHCPFFFFFLPL